MKDSDKNISIQTSDGVLISNSDRNNDLSFSIHHDNDTLQRSIINKSNSSLKINNNTNSKKDLIIEAKHSANISKDEMSDDITLLAQQEIIDPVILTGNTKEETKT